MKTSRNHAVDRRPQLVQTLEPRRLLSLTAPFGFPDTQPLSPAPAATPDVQADFKEFEAQLIASIARGVSMRSAAESTAKPSASLDDLYAELPVSTVAAIDQAGADNSKDQPISLRSPGAIAAAAIVTTAYAQAEIVKIKRRKPNLFSSSVITMNPKMIPEA